MRINWDEFKEYKRHNQNRENFDLLLTFLRSYYNMTSPIDIYQSLVDDAIGQMMLEKRDILTVESLEDYIYKKH